ncbi:MAG: hypothetical protein Q9225_004819 [Loekoesia sp. 1 TL-2023]
MARSFFSYNLSRPYPYKWFTWAVVLGGNLKPSLDRNFSDLSFFDANYHFLREIQPSGDVPIIVNQKVLSLLDYQQASVNPDIWTQVDACGKSIYSTVLADLGQSSGPNILSNGDLLQQYTQNFTSKTAANAKPGPATQSYDNLKAQTGPLVIEPSSIYQQFICQVPVRKSTGALIIAVLVADLVFLQALWKAFILCTTHFVGKQDKAMYCEGCSVKESYER